MLSLPKVEMITPSPSTAHYGTRLIICILLLSIIFFVSCGVSQTPSAAVAEAFEPIRATLWRSLMLIVIGTVLAFVLAYWRACRMWGPIRKLEEGAERIEVPYWVERQPALPRRGLVAEGCGAQRMAELVEGDADQERERNRAREREKELEVDIEECAQRRHQVAH